MSSQSFEEYLLLLKDSDESKFSAQLGVSGGYINFSNTGRGGAIKEFTLSLESILNGLYDIQNSLHDFEEIAEYSEKPWRDLGASKFKDVVLNSLVTVQTKPVFTVFSKVLCWANSLEYVDDNVIYLNGDSLQKTIDEVKKLIVEFKPKSKKMVSADTATASIIYTSLSKPFILLAGISGTGKTRFVRQQAKATDSSGQNYELISVRPDWHEPSDLLGYVSRLGKSGPVYVVGATLKFMVKAWKHIVDVTGVDITKKTTFNRAHLDQITPFWLCLDEMNLAPVEQYFADYLSVIETREWTIVGDEHTYQCEPLLKADVFAALVGEDDYGLGLTALRKDLGLGDDSYNALWEQFVENGISIPFNLIVAGTVNMDETTHGFSRKVIDRALTIDFGRFFPNVYDDFFTPTSKNKALGFPIISSARHHDFSDVPADTDGQRSIEFLTAVNTLLKDSPFELAFRALNELLLSVACFKPKDEQELQAVWDDFLMAKVLPRIEGDEDKLRTKDGGDNVLVQLESLLENQLSTIWHDAKRPDLLRTKINDSVLSIDCHSKAKLAWMRDQLNIKTFTSFWP
jgi:hypothetical protein